MAIKNNYLFYTESSSLILKLNLNESSPQPEEVFVFPPIFNPDPQHNFQDIVFHENNLYLLDNSYNKIIKLNLEE